MHDLKKKTHKRALVIEGGGFRASYAAGVLYQLLNSPQIHFDIVCANSSSVCGAAYFVTKQIDEMEEICLKHNFLGSPELLNFWRVPIAWKTSLLNIDYLFDDVFKKQFPLNLKALCESPTEFYVTIMEYKTGKQSAFQLGQEDLHAKIESRF